MPFAKSLTSLLALALAIPAYSQQPKPLMVEHGVYQVHLLLHAIGTEEYTISDLRDGRRTLTSTTQTNDRGTKRTTVSAVTYANHFEPLSFTQQSTPGTSFEMQINGGSATLNEQGTSRVVAKPALAFVSDGSLSAAIQMTMMRYWNAHGSPARLPMLRAGAQTPPVEIRLVGHEAFQIKGQMVRLNRYTVANLIFGREILWMNDSYRVAAIMTFAGGLPREEVLDEYESATSSIFHSGVRQEMLDLADLDLQSPAEADGAYAIVGARLIDGTGSPALENATVVIKNGRIVSVGPWSAPPGIRIVHAEGKTLLPGLWDMSTHYSGVEDGLALLAAGITTARDVGGEFDFLTTIRDSITSGRNNVLGPRLLLAGLIDGGGPLAFGAFDAETPADGVRIVDLYAGSHFDQIATGTHLKPEVLSAVAAEAQRRGLSVVSTDGNGQTEQAQFNGAEIGGRLSAELERDVRNGMTPMAAIQKATVEAARAMKLDGESGTIQPGKRADLILLDANPLENIANIRRVDKVITAGRMYDSKKLARLAGASLP